MPQPAYFIRLYCWPAYTRVNDPTVSFGHVAIELITHHADSSVEKKYISLYPEKKITKSPLGVLFGIEPKLAASVEEDLKLQRLNQSQA